MPGKRYVPPVIDPFSPVLFASQSLAVSTEQLSYIKRILELSASDSDFAIRAYAGILILLTVGSLPLPTVTTLVPNNVALGQPSFTLQINGTGFSPFSTIIFNGFEEPTTFVNSTRVTTGVNMPLWTAPAVVPVGVTNKQGFLSNTVNFTFHV
jgi:hypothetical protein